jgi:hypothetical protein
MKWWTIIPFTVLGVLLLGLILAFGLPENHKPEPNARCVQIATTATPTKQQKASAKICSGGTPRLPYSPGELP